LKDRGRKREMDNGFNEREREKWIERERKTD